MPLLHGCILHTVSSQSFVHENVNLTGSPTTADEERSWHCGFSDSIVDAVTPCLDVSDMTINPDTADNIPLRVNPLSVSRGEHPQAPGPATEGEGQPTPSPATRGKVQPASGPAIKDEVQLAPDPTPEGQLAPSPATEDEHLGPARSPRKRIHRLVMSLSGVETGWLLAPPQGMKSSQLPLPPLTMYSDQPMMTLPKTMVNPDILPLFP